MPGQSKALIDNLLAQREGYSQLLELLQKENNLSPAFNPNHLHELEDLQIQKESILTHLSSLEESREDIVSSQLSFLRLPQDTPLKKLAESLPDEEKSEILGIREQLLKVIESIRESSARIQETSRTRGKAFSQTLEKLTGSASGGTMYNQSGKIKKKLSSGIFSKLT